MRARRHSIAIAVACAAVLVASGCTTRPDPADYRLALPSEMSVHAVASGRLQALIADARAPPVVVTPLLVPDECTVTVLTAGASRDVALRVRANAAGPCSFALDVEGGGFHWRVDASIRFLDVPTLAPAEGPHWTGACAGALVADRDGEVFVCGFPSTVTVHDGEQALRLAGRLVATDRRGGWIVCDADACNVRGTDGVFRAIEEPEHHGRSFTPLADPPGTFLADGSDADPVLVARDTADVTSLPATPDGMPTTTTVAGGLALAGPVPRDGDEGAWHVFSGGGWRALQPSPAPFTFFPDGLPPETTVALPSGSLGLLEVDLPGARLTATAFGFRNDDLHGPEARGLRGTGLVMLRAAADEWTVLRLLRAGPRGLELLALAPADLLPDFGPLATTLLTEDTLVVASEDGSRQVRLGVTR